MNYPQKYNKYKQKYIDLKNISNKDGGGKAIPYFF